MSVEEYIKFRIGSLDPLVVFRRIFTKPFFAASLRKFWWYWNPGYGYFLLFYCYRPLRRFFSHAVAFVLTFLVCGFLHDLLYLVPMAILDDGALPLPFVSVWFLLIALGILASDYLRIDFRKVPAAIRPLIHLAFLGLTFAATMYLSAKF